MFVSVSSTCYRGVFRSVRAMKCVSALNNHTTNNMNHPLNNWVIDNWIKGVLECNTDNVHIPENFHNFCSKHNEHIC